MNASQEHRLAIVLNGGVSLAVWMGGLARELDDVRRASREGEKAAVRGDDQACAEAELFNLWQDLTNGTKLTIDVVAGTSAGGLNGLFLAMAAARDTPLAALRELWMTSAELSDTALLSPHGAEPSSILNGDFFLDKIHGALTSLAATAGPDPQDVSLTLTSTALKSAPRLLNDDYGSLFSEPDHRRRFEFRRSGEDRSYDPDTPENHYPQAARNDFTDLETIARAGRASASFPVAFAPVPESEALRRQRSWPNWSTDVPTHLEWMADGGILDNSPFEPVLQAIAAQPVAATWHRTICYIVPSAAESDRTAGIATAEGPGLPPPWPSVLQAAFGLPGEADFRDDVEQLHDLIRSGRSTLDVTRFKNLLNDPTLLAEGRALAVAGLELYRESRAAAGVYQILDANLRADRFVRSPGDLDAKAIAGRPRLWLPDAGAFPTDIPVAWTWGIGPAQRLISTLLRSWMEDPSVDDDSRRILSDLHQKATAINNYFTAELAATSIDLTPPSAAALSSAAVAENAAGLADTIFANGRIQQSLAELVVEAVTTYAETALNDRGRALDVLVAALCVEVVNGAGGAPIDTRSTPILDFIRMGVSLTPSVFGRAVAESDPGAAAGSASAILYGTRLGHFASFGKREWREWDWMWGRIHGAVHVGRLLDLSTDQVDELVEKIVRAEGHTTAEVEAGIGKVYAATQKSLLDAMKQQGQIVGAADAALSMLASKVETAPSMPARLVTASGWISAVASRRSSASQRHLLVRLLTWPLRARWWRSLRS